MALTYSQEIALGTEAPPFELPVVNPEADGLNKPTRSLEDFADAVSRGRARRDGATSARQGLSIPLLV